MSRSAANSTPIHRNDIASLSEAGAVCSNSARTDLCGGRRVTVVPTATPGIFRIFFVCGFHYVATHQIPKNLNINAITINKARQITHIEYANDFGSSAKNDALNTKSSH